MFQVLSIKKKKLSGIFLKQELIIDSCILIWQLSINVYYLQGAIQGPEEFAEGLALGVRSLFGHAVGMYILML
jgi:hypothetical protein